MCVCRSSNSNNKKTTTPPHKDYYTNKKHTTTTATSSYNKPQQTTTKAINMHWIKCLLTAFICFTVIVQVSFSLSHLSFFFAFSLVFTFNSQQQQLVVGFTFVIFDLPIFPLYLYMCACVLQLSPIHAPQCCVCECRVEELLALPACR